LKKGKRRGFPTCRKRKVLLLKIDTTKAKRKIFTKFDGGGAKWIEISAIRDGDKLKRA
jgi:hypothetical protein